MNELAKTTKKYKRNLMVGAVIVVALLLVIAMMFSKGYKNAQAKYENEIAKLEEENKRLSDPIAVYEEATREIDINAINTEVQEIGELATLEYLYTDAGRFEDARELWGKSVPFTEKSFICKWDGAIKAGVKVEKIKIEEDKKEKKIIVHIPKAEILSHEIDNQSFEVLDEKNNLFNPIKTDDVRNFDTGSKEAMETRAIESGILDKAFENAKNIIAKLVDTDVVKEQEYRVVFETIEK